MMFEIFLGNQAKKFLRKTNRRLAEELISVLSFLKANPVPAKDFDISKLSGEADSYRIRVGKYRILYKVYWNERKMICSVYYPHLKVWVSQSKASRKPSVSYPPPKGGGFRRGFRG